MTVVPRHESIVHALLSYLDRAAPTSRMIFAAEAPGAQEMSYAALAAAAGRSAAALAEDGVRHGDRVLLCLPTSPGFLTTFFGVQFLGAVPTAVATPGGFGSLELFADKFARLVDYLRPSAIVTTPAVAEALSALIRDVTVLDGDALHRRATSADAPTRAPVLPAAADVAFIQCTSGSTGTPKGVLVSHGNLAANCEQISRACGCGPDDTWVGWLPLYHDMGLIGGSLTPVFSGAAAVLLPPSRFLRAPAEWLQNVGKYRGTITAAPNFAFGYAAARIRDEDLDGVDLSTWRFLFCGAEPIVPETVRGFVDRFGRWGLPADALVPCYGMAEGALAITVAGPRAPFAHDAIGRTPLALDGDVVDVADDDPDALHIVDCGPPVSGTELRIVDAQGNPIGENQLGHIQFRGPSRTAGYFAMPAETAAATDADGWWQTGDLGYLRDGHLRVTGRHKDLIIIRGANYFPADFEKAAEAVPGVRTGGVVACGHRGPGTDSEALHLIVETEVDAAEHDQLRRAIRAAVSVRTGVLAAGIALVPKRSIPKTTSGKVQRAEAYRRFLHDSTLVTASVGAR
ncbi:fatty acyl-AMP ligase [Nocardia altamirensis]|uniref:fatty acyl-AMP ligase n=1 Tax=Nocardia altamirensis TaxID=472158 RepID=UPI0008406CF3|nr:fatty acyl-AMP ligase [Nocardia altamirensis]